MPTSRLEMSMSTAQLAEWLHWQVTWVRFLDRSSQPLADHPPVPPVLWRRGRRGGRGCEWRGGGKETGLGTCAVPPLTWQVPHYQSRQPRKEPWLSTSCPLAGKEKGSVFQNFYGTDFAAQTSAAVLRKLCQSKEREGIPEAEAPRALGGACR